MNFSPPTENELELIREGSMEYGADILRAIRERSLLVAHGRREVFLVSEEADKLLGNLDGVYCAGLSLGEIKGKKFKLGLEGAFLIAREAANRIVVNDRSEQLSLYGRDIFINSVLRYPPLKEGMKCLIVNRHGEPLALGIFRGGRVFVDNVRDRGWYLRKGG